MSLERTSGRASGNWLLIPKNATDEPGVDLGETQLTGRALEALVAEALAEVRERRERHGADRERYTPLTYAGYRDAITNHRHLYRLLTTGRRDEERESSPELWRFIGEIYRKERHPPDFKGYMQYLADVHPVLLDALNRVPAPSLPASARERHTHIIATTGWGKSELMKALAYHDIMGEEAAVVIIDPHASMVEQIARWPCFAEDPSRLVWVEPGRDDLTPIINPLEIATDASDADRETVAEQMVDVLAHLLGDEAIPTTNMETILRECIRVLLRRPGSTLNDLYRFMEPAMAQDLQKLATAHPDPFVADWFRHQFAGDSLRHAKAGIANRLRSLLGPLGFRSFTVGKSTIDLEAAIAARKVVLVSLAELGTASREAAGRLMVGLLAALGLRRLGRNSRLPRVPLHLYLDEADQFVGPAVSTILLQLRKAGVHLTLAQQVGGRGFGPSERDVLGSVAVRLFGGRGGNERALKAAGLERNDLADLERGEFVTAWDTQPPIRLRVRSDLANRSWQMDDDEWERISAEMLDRYYVARNAVPETASPSPAPTTSLDDLPLL
jgi:hypothetical protein